MTTDNEEDVIGNDEEPPSARDALSPASKDDITVNYDNDNDYDDESELRSIIVTADMDWLPPRPQICCFSLPSCCTKTNVTEAEFEGTTSYEEADMLYHKIDNVVIPTHQSQQKWTNDITNDDFPTIVRDHPLTGSASDSDDIHRHVNKGGIVQFQTASREWILRIAQLVLSMVMLDHVVDTFATNKSKKTKSTNVKDRDDDMMAIPDLEIAKDPLHDDSS